MTILFDLDGTLLDTAPDLHYSINKLLKEQNKKEISLESIRGALGTGSIESIKCAFDISDDNDPKLPYLRNRYLDIYKHNLCISTNFFPGIESLLDLLYNRKIVWGIVTNKPKAFTIPILEKLNLINKAKSIVCGDTTKNRKPHPEPLLHACNNMGVKSSECIYIGDSKTDIIAGKSAGMKTIAVKFGYAPDKQDIVNWGADFIVDKANEIEKVVENYYG